MPTILTKTPTQNTKTPTKLTKVPSTIPTNIPTKYPTVIPTKYPSQIPTQIPSKIPSTTPTNVPSKIPTNIPTAIPTTTPSNIPSASPVVVNTCEVLVLKTLNKTISGVDNTNVCNDNDNIKCEWEGIYVDKYSHVNGKVSFGGTGNAKNIDLKYENDEWNLGRFLKLEKNVDFPPRGSYVMKIFIMFLYYIVTTNVSVYTYTHL